VIGSRTLNPWTWRRHVPSKRWDPLNRRHSVTSQEIRILDVRWASKSKVGSGLEGWWLFAASCVIRHQWTRLWLKPRTAYLYFHFSSLRPLKRQLPGRHFDTYVYLTRSASLSVEVQFILLLQR
jgi:hypothetical protein